MRFIITSLFILIALQSNAQKIKFKDTNLKKALIELGYDINKNAELEKAELDTVTILKLSKRKISSLEDLVHFKNLKVVNVMTNNITSINVFFGNSTIEELYIGENKLGPKLILKDMPNLRGVYAFRNDLESVEFSGDFSKMRSLYLQGNLFVNLDIQNLPNLESLQLFECDQLKTVDISKKTNLRQFFLLDSKVVKVAWKNQDVKTIYIERKTEIEKPTQHDSIKTAPTIKVKEGVKIKTN
jgi:Leucine-rich repeat (LRR) protein